MICVWCGQNKSAAEKNYAKRHGEPTPSRFVYAGGPNIKYIRVHIFWSPLTSVLLCATRSIGRERKKKTITDTAGVGIMQNYKAFGRPAGQSVDYNKKALNCIYLYISRLPFRGSYCLFASCPSEFALSCPQV